MADFPFPFVGAGDATYFEWAEVHVVFERAPDPPEQTRISKTVPPPLTDSVDFHGPFLMVASDQFAHLAMAEAYDPDPGDEPDEEEDYGRFFFATTSQVRKFNEDTERWLREAHEICPILVAFRAEDWESGGTELSDWHHWSVRQSDRILDEIDRGSVDDDEHPGRFVLVHLLDVFEAEDRPIPDELRDIVSPGEPELAALKAGDADGLFAALEARTARLEPTLERLEGELDGTEHHAALAGLLRFMETMESPPSSLLQRLAEVLVEEEDTDELLARLVELAPRNPHGLSYVGVVAYRMLKAERWLAAARIYDRLIEQDCTDLSIYNNALYAVMDDNTGLGLQPERARRYVEAARPHGPDNPPVFYNIACVEMELGDREEALRNCELALEHDFDQLEQAREEAVFADLLGDPRFEALFE